MTQNDRLDYLISYLLKENDDLKYISIPDDISAKKQNFQSPYECAATRSCQQRILKNSR